MELAFALQRPQRAMGQHHQDVVRGGEVEDAAGMIAVLVRDENGVDVGRLEAQARKAPLGIAQREAAVDQHMREIGLRDQAVAARAARERGEAQQLT